MKNSQVTIGLLILINLYNSNQVPFSVNSRHWIFFSYSDIILQYFITRLALIDAYKYKASQLA